MLAVPPLLEKTRSGGVSRFSISVQEGVSEFVKGSPVNTLGYNGNLLGKTIRAKKGEKVSISVKNNLKEHTTTHWHGLLVPGNMDGGPHQVIKPGETWNASFTIEQPAATAWYHPHGDGNTASQVYKGLGGLFLLDDENSAKLDIPDEYGVNDVPLVIQDRLFSEDGQIHYLTSRQDYIFGMKGNKVLVNGVLEPTFEAPKGKVRFRILNGSNARTYNLYFSNKQSFDIIASDGGFLPKPAKMNSIRISPGERYEIIADFSAHKPGSEIYLADSGYNFMKVIVSSKKGFTGALPEKLAEYDPADMSKVVASRRFYMNGMGNMVNINGRRMDMRRINEYMTLGTTEIWNVVSRMGMMRGGSSDILHNFHAHGTLFKVISRNGKPPAPEERGWKDTVALPDNEVVQLMASFNHKGIFMYHCHILEHEDRGMMGQYIVK
ncbi:MAG: copper oxidase [Denitrovibrio sp.]|nr:MAG: copper oxidase [Denitrovibrio sp.]